MGADSDIRKDTSAPVPSICVEGGLTDSKKDQQQFIPVSMAVYGVHSRGSLSILKPPAPELSGRSRPVPRQSKQPLVQAFKTAERGASGLDVNGMRPTSPAAWQIMREELRARRVRSLPAHYSFHIAFLSAAWCMLGYQELSSFLRTHGSNPRVLSTGEDDIAAGGAICSGEEYSCY